MICLQQLQMLLLLQHVAAATDADAAIFGQLLHVRNRTMVIGGKRHLCKCQACLINANYEPGRNMANMLLVTPATLVQVRWQISDIQTCTWVNLNLCNSCWHGSSSNSMPMQQQQQHQHIRLWEQQATGRSNSNSIVGNEDCN